MKCSDDCKVCDPAWDGAEQECCAGDPMPDSDLAQDEDNAYAQFMQVEECLMYGG